MCENYVKVVIYYQEICVIKYYILVFLQLRPASPENIVENSVHLNCTKLH